ncbi:hypothetical protein ABIA03_003109 [Bradyrhizobium yuanmingense]|uniref:DUF433 domain-containing protein n=1 Tax=Bradyrhizobium yuanmingense TaxID=108015 RepID=A0ABV4GGH6_9BRAD
MAWPSRASRWTLPSALAKLAFAGCVFRLLGLLAAGETRESILNEYRYLEREDIDEALRYAAFLAEDLAVDLSPPAEQE